MDKEPLEFSRRTFMANATLTIGGVVGLGLAIPLLGALKPDLNTGSPSWATLDNRGWTELEKATSGAIQIDFHLRGKDAYLPEQTSAQSVWGIRVNDPERFIRDRSDLFNRNGK